MNRGRSVRLLVAAAGLAVSLASGAASAGPPTIELCQLAGGTSEEAGANVEAWNNLDSENDAKYTWWANRTQDGCIRVI